jgi:hypothetical protein
MVFRKFPVAELVLYIDVLVQKLAKKAKKCHFWAYFDPLFSKNKKFANFWAFLWYEKDGCSFLFLWIWLI